MKKFRDTGAVGALLDEYEKAVNELLNLIDDLKPRELLTIVDQKTEDEDCRSIQTVLTHVIRSGYCYADEVKKYKGEVLEFPKRKLLNTVREYQLALRQMFAYNVAVFDSYPDLEMETLEPEKKMATRWGQQYDLEQLYEHAIVHVLRHRRQIERFLIQIRPL